MIRSRASIRCGVLRRWVPTCTTRCVLAGRGQHGLPFPHVDADRFLNVNVHARLDGRDHRQGVPVIGCADQDDVEVLLLEQLSVVS